MFDVYTLCLSAKKLDGDSTHVPGFVGKETKVQKLNKTSASIVYEGCSCDMCLQQLLDQISRA